MLSFLCYFLLKNPRAYQRAQGEVDRVIGRRRITVEDMSKLPYINAVMREILRVRLTAPAISLHAHPIKNHEDPLVLGGRYILQKDGPIIFLLGKLHRDAEVCGPDAEEFKPEQMLDKNFDKLPTNA